MEDFLNYTLFHFGKFTISVYHLVLVGLVVLVTWFVLFLVRTGIYRSSNLDAGRKYALFQITRYFLMIISIAIGLEVMGIKLTVVLAGSAALLVGIGLGLQNLFNDFVSGIILLVDASVKVNDVIEVDGLVARMQKINLRTSVVQTRDEKYIIVPNSVLTGSKLINWTHQNQLSRFEITVGVAYASDVDKVLVILANAAKEHPNVSSTREPRARLLDFADSSINFELLFWTDEVFGVENTKSDIRIAICQAFREQGVEIPFPQRVVHMQEKKV